jgi:hypothetical protein
VCSCMAISDKPPVELHTAINKALYLEDRSTGSHAAVTLSKYWLATCPRTHKTCQGNDGTYIPTRLVEILSEGMIRLVERTSSSKVYAALSHRWSQDEASKTTSFNFPARLSSFRANELSPTLSDSIRSVHDLGYQYVWIDMLCIIQDSKSDWLREAAEMRHVYSNAVITIAAECVSGKAVGEGMFSSRNLSTLRPFPLHQLENYTDEKLESIFRTGDATEDKRLCIFPDTGNEQYANRPKGVLDTRGWILQEQLLSPRILYYGHEQLYWDCISQSASEVSPIGLSLLDDANSGETWAFRLIRRTIAGKGDQEMLAKLIADVWMYVVENYSARTLTQSSDKIIALQGVITALESVLQLSSVAGMWQKDLWKQITWAASPAIDTPSENPPFPAPTWSWLSVDGAVSHRHSIRMDRQSNLLNDLAPIPDLRCTITDVHARSTSVSALLDLRAPNFSYKLTTNDLREIIWKQLRSGMRDLAPARWMLDSELDLPLEMQCVIIAEDEVAKITVGMCLLADGSQPDIWKRVGVFLWDGLTWQIAKHIGQELQVGHFVVV